MKKSQFNIFHGDCCAIMHNLHQQGQIINHIITDPPYAISQKNSFHTMKKAVNGINFGDWDWGFDITGWLDLAYPLLAKDGSMVIFCSYRYLSQIIQKIESLGGLVKDIMVWQKSNPMPRNVNRRYVQDMEFVIWAVKSKSSKWTFNKPSDKPYQRGFFQTSILMGKERTRHPTQKPVALMKKIIQIHSKENDIIDLLRKYPEDLQFPNEIRKPNPKKRQGIQTAHRCNARPFS